MALTGVIPSHDGRHTAYTISRSGSDWTEIYVLDTAHRQAAARPHRNGPSSPARHGTATLLTTTALTLPRSRQGILRCKTKYHKVTTIKLRTPKRGQGGVREIPNSPLYSTLADVSDDEKHHVGHRIGTRPRQYSCLQEPRKAGKWTSLADSQDYTAAPIGVVDGKSTCSNSIDAPRNRLVCIDLARPGVKTGVSTYARRCRRRRAHQRAVLRQGQTP